MHRRSIDVSAENETEALSKGASELGTSAGNLNLSILSKGEYRVKLIRADAEVEIKVSKDSLEASIDEYVPSTGGAPPLCVEKLHAALKEAGVVYGIDEDELATAAENAQNGKNIRGHVLARGKALERPKDASVYSPGNLRQPVFPGMIVCRKSVLSEGAAGMDVRGMEIPLGSTGKGKDIALTARGGVEITEHGTAAVATVYGIGSVVNGQVEVEPLFTVSDDALSVTATLYTADSEGNEITQERIVEALTREGFVGDINTVAIDTALSRIKEDTEVAVTVAEGVVVLTGKAPESGIDGQLIMSVDDEKVAGTEDNKGQIDFHERSTFRSVSKGDEIARIVLPTSGTAGADVHGGVIPAAAGEEVSLQIGENVVAPGEGRILIADIDGVVVHAGDRISVSDVIEIPGDVDYESGNVHMEKGSVLIKGGVRTGFTVDVPGNVMVGEGIEGAEVTAGGDIEVKRGLIMHDKGKIVARGSISAHFAENADVEAGEDISIDNNISNCHVIAGGKISVISGKGVIVGGDVCANGGVEANEIGSELGVETHVTIGVDSDEKQALLRKKQELQKSINKIDLVIGEGDFKSIIMKAPPSKRMALGKLIKARIRIVANMDHIDKQLDAILEEERSREKSTVVIHNILHSGVHLLICGQHLDVKKSISHCCVKYDPNGERLRIVSIDAA